MCHGTTVQAAPLVFLGGRTPTSRTTSLNSRRSTPVASPLFPTARPLPILVAPAGGKKPDPEQPEQPHTRRVVVVCDPRQTQTQTAPRKVPVAHVATPRAPGKGVAPQVCGVGCPCLSCRVLSPPNRDELVHLGDGLSMANTQPSAPVRAILQKLGALAAHLPWRARYRSRQSRGRRPKAVAPLSPEMMRKGSEKVETEHESLASLGPSSPSPDSAMFFLS